MANLSLVFDLVGRDLSASKAFKDVGDSADRAGKSGENFGSKVAGGLKVAAAGLLGAGLIEGFKSLYDAAAESAKIGRLTEQVIKSTGGAAGISAKQVGDLATAISKKTGVDDEAIQSGANLLLTFTNVRNEVGKGNDIFNQATGIITDMSAALGQDTSSSAIQLGKALNDPIKGVTALQRVGVSFTASQKEQITTLVQSGKTMDAQKLILAELTKEFGGAAAAAGTPFDKLKVSLGNLAETLGSNLIPYVDRFSNFMMDDVLPAVQDVGGVVSGTLGPALSLAVDLFKDLFDTGVAVVRFVNDLPGPLKAAVISLGAMAVLKGPLGSLFETLRDTAQTAALRALYLKDALGSVGGAAGLAKTGVGGLVSFLGGPVGIAVGLVAASFALLSSKTKENTEVTHSAADVQRELADALRQSKGAIDDNVRAAAAKSLQDKGILDIAEKSGISLSRVTDAILGNKDAYTEVSAALQTYYNNRLIASGYEEHGKTTMHDQADAAGQAVEDFNTLAGTLGSTATKQQQLAAASNEAGTGMGNASQSAKQLFADLKDTADAAGEARQQTDLFKTSLDILTGKNVDLLQVQAQLQDALASAKDAMDKEGGAVLTAAGALNLQSENGRKASDVLLDVRNSGNELISTMIQQGKTTADVQKADADLRASFINTAGQMGISRQAAENLANQILGIPAERTTTINADTGSATKSLAQIQKDVDNLHGKDITVTVSAQGGLATYTTDQRNLLYSGKAAGGPIFGPGTGTSDSAGLFALSNGEHVWTAEEVSAAGGHAAIETMRKGVLAAGRGRAAGGPINIHEILDSRPVDAVIEKAKKSLTASIASPGGSVQRWAGLVAQVLGMLGQPTGLVGAVLQLIQHESGGNPNAINLTDSNARAGHPSQGLTQTIPGTFAAYAGQFRGLGITNPLANIYAGLNYGIHRYGAISLIPGIRSLAGGGGYKPYDSGGLLQPGLTLAYNGTGKAETVRTAEQEAALGNGGLSGLEITGILQIGGDGLARIVDGRIVTVLTGATDRGRNNPA